MYQSLYVYVLFDLVVLLLGVYSKEIIKNVHTDLCSNMFLIAGSWEKSVFQQECSG